MKKTVFWVAFWTALCGAACSRLPSYSHPRVEARGVPVSSQVIAYRTLTVEDFRAAELPEDLQSHQVDLNAHTMVALRTRPGAQYILSLVDSAGKQLTCARVDQPIFEAMMIPEKSWWRPTLKSDKVAYVLQHEQVHFALMEIAARRLNQKIIASAHLLKVCREDADTALATISATLDQWLAEAERQALKDHMAFDEETSQHHVPQLQQRWYDRVVAELQLLASGAANIPQVGRPVD